MSQPLLIAVLISSALIAGCGKTPRNHAIARSISPQTFACDSGRVVQVAFPDNERATLTYAERSSEMFAKPAASGTLYIGDGLEWHAKGSGPGAEGLLSRDSTGHLLETCRVPQSAAAGDNGFSDRQLA